MSYPNYKLDLGKIIQEVNQREKEKWERIMEYCRKNNKNQRELVREAFEDIKRRNKEKLKKLEDPNDYLERVASLNDKLFSLFSKKIFNLYYSLNDSSYGKKYPYSQHE